MNIPRVIHQTISDKRHLVPELSDNIRVLQTRNPGWRHMLYDDADVEAFIDQQGDAKVRKAFYSINPLYGAARADFFRYLLLLKEGGVYLDIKSNCSVPLDELIREDDGFLLSHWRNEAKGKFDSWGIHPQDGVLNEFQNWHIICAPGHAFLRAVVDEVITRLGRYSMREFGVGRLAVWRTTGPIAYTKAIAPLLARHDHRTFDAEGSGLVYSTLESYANKVGHSALFRRHYSQVIMPVVSKGRETVFHRARYRLLHLLGYLR